MTLRDRLRLRIEVINQYARQRDEGKTHKQAKETIKAAFKSSHGNRADWNAILDLILAVIEALRKVLVR